MPHCRRPRVEPWVGPERCLRFSLGIVSQQYLNSPPPIFTSLPRFLSLELWAKNFARDGNTLAKVLRMNNARQNCNQKSLCKKGGIVCMHVKENLQDNFWLVNLKLASVVHMVSSQSSIFIWYFVILTGLENTWTLYGLIFVKQMCWQTENTLRQMESSRTYYSINSLTCKLLQCFYLPKPKQYGKYLIEFKSFHQNGNISKTVAWKMWYMTDQI
jgi:hypothetical protein